ncbi:hypothetical protein AB0F81_48290 [Actinoplanes sp. NPDC024001]|uniref:SPW repeat domain-containing protein n=1 Tax=Actinoplanes sp. NPDC024001 TaxID=3154598 RepID=UPI003406465F
MAAELLGLAPIVLGFWLIAAPFLLGYDGGASATAATWNSFAVGAGVAVVATFAVPDTESPRRDDRFAGRRIV